MSDPKHASSEERSVGQKIIMPETAYMAYEAMSKLGFKLGSADDFTAALARLDSGLPLEHEFAALVLWLGRCVCVHGLDQRQNVSSRSKYKIPDLLGVFDHAGTSRRFLIEVKTTKHDTLKWTHTYSSKLRRYSDTVGIPLLVAWKWRPFGVWALFDAEHVLTGKSLKFGEAMRQNLMGIVAGDFNIVLKPGLGIHFVTSPVTFHGEGPAYATPELLMPGEWTFKIDDAYFTNANGERLNHVQKGLWHVLLSMPDLVEQQEFKDGKMRISWIVTPGESGMQSAQRILFAMVALALNDSERPDWRKIATHEQFPAACSTIRAGMEEGFKNATVQYVLDQLPVDTPIFLRGGNAD